MASLIIDQIKASQYQSRLAKHAFLVGGRTPVHVGAAPHIVIITAKQVSKKEREKDVENKTGKVTPKYASLPSYKYKKKDNPGRKQLSIFPPAPKNQG